MTTTSTWHQNEKLIIKRMRKLCKLGVLIELPLFRGTAKARFIDATALKPCTHWNGKSFPASEYIPGYKAIIYTVSSASGVIRTWIPVESIRFQNDGAATAMNTDGKNHTPDDIELMIHRHKYSMVENDNTKFKIQEYVKRYKAMVKSGGIKTVEGSLLRFLDEFGVEVTPGIKEIFNTGNGIELDEAAHSVLKKLGYEHAMYPEYQGGYPVYC